MTEQILWRWLLGEESPPSLQIAGILIKGTFLPTLASLKYWFLSSKQLNLIQYKANLHP